MATIDLDLDAEVEEVGGTWVRLLVRAPGFLNQRISFDMPHQLTAEAFRGAMLRRETVRVSIEIPPVG